MMMTSCPFTVLYREVNRRGGVEWVLIEKHESRVVHNRIRVTLPDLDAAIEFVAERYQCPPEHWVVRDPDRHIAKARRT